MRIPLALHPHDSPPRSAKDNMMKGYPRLAVFGGAAVTVVAFMAEITLQDHTWNGLGAPDYFRLFLFLGILFLTAGTIWGLIMKDWSFEVGFIAIAIGLMAWILMPTGG